MYHFSVAYEKGLALDMIKYFADESNRDLGIIKRPQKRKKISYLKPH